MMFGGLAVGFVSCCYVSGSGRSVSGSGCYASGSGCCIVAPSLLALTRAVDALLTYGLCFILVLLCIVVGLVLKAWVSGG